MYTFQRVRIIFNHFSLEDDCDDRVLISDVQVGQYLKLCKKTPSGMLNFISYGDFVEIEFYSDRVGVNSGISATIIFIRSIFNGYSPCFRLSVIYHEKQYLCFDKVLRTK